tara:strand:+ start:43255 stop:45837 length:2583 start_codon:yes stop_codon:yes gene_type:complete
MNKKVINSSLVLLALFFILTGCGQQEHESLKKELAVKFNGDASVEVGSPFVGLEFHHSSPLPQRISFYYPVANSIDLSTDYWTRDKTVSMVMGLKTGDEDSKWIGFEPFEMELTPYEVTYTKKEEHHDITVNYQFSKDSPVVIITYTIKNTSSSSELYEFYTDLQASLRTSHTYATKDKAWSEFERKGNSIFINFEEEETQNVQLFATNYGLQPVAYSAVSSLDSLPATEKWWDGIDLVLDNQTASKSNPKTPAIRYLYKTQVASGDEVKIVQIIGSTNRGKGRALVSQLLETAQDEADAYEKQVLDYVSNNVFVTGDSVLDHSVLWANSILNVNRHYIDGSIQPMPSPAEYNFYFTHDVLLTDLATVNFDLPRVKHDLEFILEHADSNFVIPHAYYWKDDKFATEIAPPDNWNHFWFVIVAGSYLRHSGDQDFLKEMYPYLSKSVHDFKTHKKNDIIYSYRPDWWDIARNFGPRSYTTILAIKALREYVFISSQLGENEELLVEWEEEIEMMQKGLNEQLWSEEQEYLINYFEDGTLDEHYYIGSLLGSHYDVLNAERKEKLTETAAAKIVDPKIGVYAVYPMDFQNLIEYLKLEGNEAGDPFYYINGGIWPQGNAWYALSLMEIGKKEEALGFIKDIMTVDGAINSPNGQPAMYEYRVSNKDDATVYGKIDKPQFTWAAGWYLYSLYNLFGIKETEWNVRFDPYLSKNQHAVQFDLAASGLELSVKIEGEGEQVQNILLNEKPYYSLVLPAKITEEQKSVKIIKGQLKTPLLTEINAVLESVSYSELKEELSFSVSSFEGHKVKAVIQSLRKPSELYHNREKIKSWVSEYTSGMYVTEISINQSKKIDTILAVLTGLN